MIVNINVTEEDIAKGKRGDCSACPIALAAERALSEKFGDGIVNVCPLFISFTVNDPFTKALSNTPYRMREFMWNFDNKQEVAPFSMDIEFLITN